MGQAYRQIASDERHRISHLHEDGKTIRQIATIMDRSPSTISRELKRNGRVDKSYSAQYAHQQTKARRWQGMKLERDCAHREAILTYLKRGWSPEAIAGYTQRYDRKNTISYETIYRFIDKQIRSKKDYSWRHFLPRAKSRRGWYRPKSGTLNYLKNRVSIHDRSEAVHRRRQFGHWETDMMAFGNKGAIMLVAVERKSRMLLMMKQANKEAEPIARQLINWFQDLPKGLRQSCTFECVTCPFGTTGPSLSDIGGSTLKSQ